MSGDHGRSVFANSCIKKPLSPRSKHPNPSYLVPQCSLDRGPDDPRAQDNMNVITKKKANSKCPLARTGHQRRTKCCSITHQFRKETDNFQSLVKFYDSIPDYDDLHHLPNEEFYCKLNTLRKKQRELRYGCGYESRCSRRELKAPVVSVAPPTISEQNDDNDSLHSWSKSPPATTGILNGTRKGSAKSVRIETTKEDDESDGRTSRTKFRAGTPFVSDHEDSTKNASTCTTPVNSDFVERYDRYVKRNLRCKSASPIRDYSKVTVPQPYKMTQREEEGRALQELLIASKNAFSSKEALNKPPSTIKANPIPITSRIPLLNTIMADQEYRNKLAKLNSEIELQSQIKPFHFSERLSRPNNRCLSRSLSSPALLTTGFESDLKSPATFKAKPCPKNLFSNYFYFKMWEDEYFRNMTKRIRAEELMKHSSLPPSMARREKHQRKSYALLHTDSAAEGASPTKSKRKRKLKRSAKRKKSVEERCSEYFASVGNVFDQPPPLQLKPSTVKPLYPSSNSSCSTSVDVHQSGGNPAPIYPVNRPNLAATLRTEWCRKKLRELDLEDSVNLKKTPRFQWGVKRSQAFQNLNIDQTHQEELNLRLATRRAEQKLRQEEHAINMELMRQRVKAAPLLLEGPPQWGPRLGHVTHRCMLSSGKDADPLFRKTAAEKGGKGNKKGLLMGGMKKRESSSCGRASSHQQDHNHRLSEKHRSSSGSKLSNYSVDSFGKSSSKFCDSEALESFTDDV